MADILTAIEAVKTKYDLAITLKPEQSEVNTQVLHGKDVFALLPTGYVHFRASNIWFIWAKLRQTPVQWPVKVVGQTEDGLSVYVKSDHAVNEVPADDEIFAEMSESEAENEDDLEVLDDDDEPKKSKSVKHKRQQWDSVETEEINKYFKHFLDAGIVPRTKDVTMAQKKSKKASGKIWMRSVDKIVKKISAMNHKK